MPPALAKAVLSTIKPTEKELAEAKAHIEALNCAQQNSKRVSMNSFLKKKPRPRVAAERRQGGCHAEFPRARHEVQDVRKEMVEPEGSDNGEDVIVAASLDV
jgi:hypothetical protein